MFLFYCCYKVGGPHAISLSLSLSLSILSIYLYLSVYLSVNTPFGSLRAHGQFLEKLPYANYSDEGDNKGLRLVNIGVMRHSTYLYIFK